MTRHARLPLEMFGSAVDAVTTSLEFPESFKGHRSNLFECISSRKLFSNFGKGHDQFSFGNFLCERNESEGILHEKVTHKSPSLVQVDRRGLG